MEERSERWNAVSPSQFDHEKRGLKALARAVPDAEPYRVWTNFQFTGNDGQDYEVDALVIGRAGIYVVELKDWSGVITGNDHQLEVHPRTGLPYSQRHPVKTTQSKARVLVSRFKNEIAAVVKAAKEVGIDVSRVEQRVPWIQGVVFLTNPRVNVSGVSDIGLQNVYGLDTDSHSPIQDPRLQGIGSCITTAPTDSRREINEDQSKIILAQAMDRIAGFSRKNKHLGDWVLEEVEDEYDSVRFYSAHRRDDDNLKALLRVITLNPDTQEASFKYEYNLQKREFQRLRELRHDRIDSPDNFFNQGNMIVMVFPRGTGQFEPLDRLLPGVSFTAEQQVQLIQQIAEAVDYAHQNNLSHRNLGPNSVLVDRKALAEGRVVSRVTGWTAAGQIEREGTQTAGLTITPHRSQLVDDMYDMFFPPEYYPEGSDKRLGDLFSIGALAYFIIANGTMPAHNRLALIEKLRITGGLDLGETGSEVEPEFRHLVRGITAAQPSQRAKAVRKPNSAHDEPNPVRAFIQRLQEVTDERVSDVADPANPALNAKINDRFRVDEVLGAGSTARGLLVTDLQDIDADQRVLKVALDEDKHGRLDGEAATIQEIHEKLPKSVNPQRFVQLIEGPLKLQHGRYGLLLSVCGSRTLADVLGSSMPMGQQFWMLGLQLVEILVALEETGVFHRDIKPSNLGVVGKPSEMRLSLFDFSLSKDPLTAIEAGTAQYRDPFLGAQRPRFDSYAERYAVTVVLYQLATREFPVYSDDDTLPALTDGQILLADTAFQDLFPGRPNQAKALGEFFRKNLAKDKATRADSAKQLLADLRAVQKLEERTTTSPQKPSTSSVPSEPTVIPTPDNQAPITGLAHLVDELRAHAGKKDSSQRKFVSRVLGVVDSAPADPFAPNAQYAKSLNVTPGRIPQITQEIPQLWASTNELATVYEQVRETLKDEIKGNGGIATPAELAPAVSKLFPDDVADHQTRTLLGVIRLVQLSLEKEQDPGQQRQFVSLRRGITQTLIALANPPGFGTLHHDLAHSVKHALAQAPSGIIPASRLTNLLTKATASSLHIQPSAIPFKLSMLPELATTALNKVALTPTGDVYATDMTAAQLVAAVFPRTAERISRKDLKDLINTRFPQAELTELPKHPELDTLVQTQSPLMVYDGQRSEYILPKQDTVTYVETRVPTSATLAQIQAEGYSDLIAVLKATIPERQFRFVATNLHSTSVIVEELVKEFDVPHVDVTRAVFNKLDQVASSEQELINVLAADTPQHAQQMHAILRQWSQEVLDEALDTTAPAVILTDISILVSYGNQDLLERYMDITTNHNRSAIWVVIPEEAHSSAHGLEIEGHSISLSSTNQLVKA